jgi:protease-4
VGSIGVYMPRMDMTGWHERIGMKPDPIVNSGGVHKASGFRGMALTDEQRAELQRFVDAAFASFQGHVLAARRVSPEMLTGSVYHGGEALAGGLVDELGGVRRAISDARILHA